jgi:multimeric flavodoxin WrbA
MPKNPKVLGIAGSPRRNGNSTTLLKATLAAAAEAGAETSLIRLNDLHFKGCQACPDCPDDGCRTRDDMLPVLSALTLADVWILASPVYFDSVSGPMKTFFDRLYWFTRKGGTQQNPRLAGRRRAAFIVTYEDPENAFYREMVEHLARYFPWFGGFEKGEVLAFSRLGPADAAAGKPELLEQARALGRRLAAAVAEAK